MAQWQDRFPKPEKTTVQTLIDQDQGRVEQLLAEQAEVEANQNEQVEVQKSYAEMVRMYPGQFAKAKKLVEEGVHDRATIARILRQEEEKKTKVPQARTVWEKGKESWSRSKNSAALDIKWFEYLTAASDPDGIQLSELKRITSELDQVNEEDPITAEGTFEKFVVYTSSALPSLWEGAKYGAGGGALAAGGALVAGQLGPQVLAPEEIFTVPVAFAGGASAASTGYWVMQGQGNIFRETIMSGVEPNNARMIASLGGAAYGLIEQLQATKLLPAGFKSGFSDLITQTVSQTLVKVGKAGALNYGEQIGQEVAQEVVLITSQELAVYFDNEINAGNIPQKEGNEILDQLLNTLEQSAYSFVPIVGTSTTISAGQAVSGVRQQQAVESKQEEEIALEVMKPKYAQLTTKKRKTQEKAVDEVDAALASGQTSPGTATLAKFLLQQDPDFESKSSLAISNEVVKLTDNYIKTVLKQDPEEFFTNEGITREEAEEYYATGSTQVNFQKGTTKTAINLYKGHDADTLVEEWYHDFFEHLDEKSKAAFDKYHKESEDTRSLEEHFGQEGRDFFFSEKLHENAGPIREIFEQARKTLKDLIERIRKIRGAKIPQKIQDLYKDAAQRKLPSDVKVQPTDKKQFQVKRVPKASENVPVLPTGPIEDQLNKAFKRKPEPSSIMLKKVQGAPSKRKGMERTLDKDVKIEPYNVYVERAKSVRDKSPEQGLWYNEYGEGGKKIAGKENMREFSILFGVTSSQTKTTDNLDNTIHIMTIARKINPVKNEAEFRAELRKPKPSGNKMLITDSQIDSIIEMYKTGTYKGGLKVSTYMQTVEAAAKNEFMPFTVNDVHMQRFFGFLRKDKQGKTLGINESNHRYIQYLTSKIAEDMGVAPSQAQAYMWQWARENLSDVKSVGTWAEAVKYSENSINEWNKVKSPVININAKFGEGAKPGYTGSQKTGPYSNVLYTDAIMKEINRKSPKVLASFVPGRARGFLTGEVDLKKAREYDDAVFKAITDESGQIKFLKDIKIPHEVVRTMGSYGNLETSYQIILPGASLETAEMVAAYLGDAGLQDSAIHYKNTFGDGDLGGLAVTKSDNKVWTDTEIEKFHTTVNPNNDVDGVNFYQSSDGKQLRVMVFLGMEDAVSKALESYDSMTNFEIGRFDQTGDLTEHESYNRKIREAVKKQPLLRLRRSNIQRSSQRNLYRPIQEVYKKFEKDFQPKQKITFQARKKAKPTLELDPETTMGLLQRKIQDKMNRLGHVVEKVKEQEIVSDENDAYIASELYIGKAKERMDVFVKQTFGEKGSLLDRIVKTGYTIDDFGEYLHARHAKERNAHIASIRDDMPDGGSGMTNAQANKILKKYVGDKKIKAFATEFYNKVTKKALKDRLKAGLITEETYETLSTYYKNYVPLFPIKDVENRSQTSNSGKGFSVPQAGELKRARGSQEARFNPVVSSIYEMLNMIKRAEKNQVGLKFLKMAEKYESSAWDVEMQTYKPVYGKDGEIQYMDPKFKLDDNVFAVRKEGKLYFVTIEDDALVNGLKNLGAERGYKILTKINSYLRNVVTTYNPAFAPINFIRDIQTAIVHLGGEYEGVAGTAVKNVLPAMRGVWKNIRNKESNYWSEKYQEMKNEGGKVGWFDLETLEEFHNKVNKQLERVEKGAGSPILAAKALGDFINDYNEAVESSVRLATYDALVKKGLSKSKAAQAAKNITVNFNKKGELGTAFNSLYLFGNATVQSGARIAVSIGRNRKVQAIVASIAGMSASLSLFNYMVAPEEWEKKSRWDKDNYLIVMMPDGDDVRIRVPYGYNVFHVAGQVAGDLIQKGIVEDKGFKNLDYFSPEGAGARIFKGISDAYSPFGDGSPIQMGTPSFADPFVQMWENKNYMGNPIYPTNPYQEKLADSYNYWEKNPPSWASRMIADGLFELGGGTVKSKKNKEGEIEEHRTRPGHLGRWFDVNPITLDHFGRVVGGGLGRTVSRFADMGINFATNTKTDPRDMPLIRQFYRKPSKLARTEKQLIYYMKEESKRTIFNHVEVTRFKRYVADAIIKGELNENLSKMVKIDDDGDYKADREVPRVIRDFLNNQRLARGEDKINYQKVKGLKKKKKRKVTF